MATPTTSQDGVSHQALQEADSILADLKAALPAQAEQAPHPHQDYLDLADQTESMTVAEMEALVQAYTLRHQERARKAREEQERANVEERVAQIKTEAGINP